MYVRVKIQMHFWSNYLIFQIDFFYRCVDCEKFFKNKKIFIFIWRKYEKKNNGQSWVLLYGTKNDVK
jgi:hypothetical protein